MPDRKRIKSATRNFEAAARRAAERRAANPERERARQAELHRMSAGRTYPKLDELTRLAQVEQNRVLYPHLFRKEG